jgi:WD40 repeat protein
MRAYWGLLFGLITAPLAAADAPAKVSYYRDVRPIFQIHCNGCHQPAKPLGGYVMTEFADLLQAGDRGEAGVVPGKPAVSMLLKQITAVEGKKPEMPKGRDPLLDQQVTLVRRWIAEGAVDDTPASAKAPLVDAEHPPVYTLPPVVTAVAFSPDGQLLAVSGYHEVVLHKADGSGVVGRLIGLAERIQALAFAPDGKWLAVAGGSPGRFGELQVWDVAKQQLKYSLPVTFDTIYGVSWAPDSSKIAFGCADNTVRAVEASTGKQVLFQGAHSDWVLETVFSSDGQHVVSVSRDRSMKLTEVSTQRFIDNITSITPGALKGGLATVALRPLKTKNVAKALIDDSGITADKQYDELLVGGSDGVPRLYKMHRVTKRVIGDDANKIRDYEALPGRLYASAFAPDGERFVVGSSFDGKGEARIYQTGDGKRVASLEGPLAPVYTLRYKPDGTQIACAGFDGTVRLFDANTGKLVKQFPAVPMNK